MSNPYDRSRDENASILGSTLKFKGELTADEDLLIQGQVEGTIRHSSSLTIGDTGHVKADVSAEYIAVDGRVDGDLRGVKSVKIRESAQINGNIVSPNVALLEGAKFNGKIDMDSDPAAKAAPKPEKKAQKEPARRKEQKVQQPKGAPATDEADKKSADAA